MNLGKFDWKGDQSFIEAAGAKIFYNTRTILLFYYFSKVPKGRYKIKPYNEILGTRLKKSAFPQKK